MEVRQRSRLSHFAVIFFVIMARDQASRDPAGRELDRGVGKIQGIPHAVSVASFRASFCSARGYRLSGFIPSCSFWRGISVCGAVSVSV
jgi:hypothetical protein